jgi:hypothetical protein
MSSNWTNEKSFNNYNEATEFKNTLQQSSRGATLQVKIHKYETLNGTDIYIVKVRTDPSLEEAVKQVEEKLANPKRKKGEK